MNLFRPALSLLVLLTLLTGLGYPLLTTGLGQWLFPATSQGSLIEQGGELRGSLLIGQAFSRPEYFQGRPSATADQPNNPLASGGSNLSASNPQLLARVDQQLRLQRTENPNASPKVPTELVTTSASGLDPTLSIAAAQWQAPRVASARGLSVEQVQQLIRDHAEKPRLSFLGPTVVNVVAMNLALDKLARGK